MVVKIYQRELMLTFCPKMGRLPITLANPIAIMFTAARD